MASRLCKAIRVSEFGSPAVLRVADVAIPSPGPGQVLIRARAIGVNPVETYLRSGAYAALPTLPYTPGNDCAGVVAELGVGCKGKVAPGQHVFTVRTVSGAYAEYVVAEEASVFPFSDKLTFAEAASLPTPAFTAYRALFAKLNVRPGRSLLVHGATGAVGVAAVQLARAHGLQVIGTAGSEEGAALLAPLCDHVLRHDTIAALPAAAAAGPASGTGPSGPPPPIVDAVRSLIAGGEGVHYILEMRADANLGADLQILRRGGAVCIVGSRGSTTINPRDIMAREATVTAVMLYSNSGEDWVEAAAHIDAAVRAGSLKPIVGSTHVGLGSAPAAHEEVIGHGARGAQGKIVIELPLHLPLEAHPEARGAAAAGGAGGSA